MLSYKLEVKWGVCSKGYFIVCISLPQRFPQALKKIRYSFFPHPCIFFFVSSVFHGGAARINLSQNEPFTTYDFARTIPSVSIIKCHFSMRHRFTPGNLKGIYETLPSGWVVHEWNVKHSNATTDCINLHFQTGWFITGSASHLQMNMPRVRNRTESSAMNRVHTGWRGRLLLLLLCTCSLRTVWIYPNCSQGNKDYKVNAFPFHPIVLFSPVENTRQEWGLEAQSNPGELVQKPLCTQLCGILSMLYIKWASAIQWDHLNTLYHTSFSQKRVSRPK